MLRNIGHCCFFRSKFFVNRGQCCKIGIHGVLQFGAEQIGPGRAIVEGGLGDETAMLAMPDGSGEVTTGTIPPVGILPDGYVCTNPLPQIPTKQSVPPSKDSLLGYYGIPLAIPTLRSLIGPAIDKVQIPWLSFH